jgi:hypothetical protein
MSCHTGLIGSLVYVNTSTVLRQTLELYSSVFSSSNTVPYQKSASIALFTHKQANFSTLELYQFYMDLPNFLIIRCQIPCISTYMHIRLAILVQHMLHMVS